MTKTQREALKVLRAVAPRRATVPILTHALLDAGGARVTDLEIEAEASAEALGVTVEGSGAINVADLAVALEAGAGVLIFEGNRCKWSGGEFCTLPAADFPAPYAASFPKGEGRRDADGLPAALAVVACAMTANDVRYSLNGAGLTPLGNVVATDGHRLHLTAGPLLELDKETWTVPASAVKILAGWRGALTVERFGEALEFVGAPGVLRARRLEGRFPNYEKVFPRETPHRWTVDAGEFMRATEGLHKFSNKRTHATVIEANGALNLTATCPESGEMRASVPLADGAGLPVRFGINLGYLRDAVEACGGRVQMQLGKGGDDKAGVYLPGALHLTGERGEAVVMPMRI